MRRFQILTSRLFKIDGKPTSGHFLVISFVQLQKMGCFSNLKDIIKPNLFLHKFRRRFHKSTSRLLKMNESPTSGHFLVLSCYNMWITADVRHFESKGWYQTKFFSYTKLGVHSKNRPPDYSKWIEHPLLATFWYFLFKLCE